ncbi:hypothetical protein B0H14DRAFT_3463912 [Mycena olivaceomarginata]|nr:hypothetical protein B0H14DRAFT_3463912 [Mycena olivaceomarginata]
MLDKSQWIGVQKKWASVPSWLKKLAAEYFLIPQKLEADLIPLPYLCIAELLAFPFPLQNAASIALQPAQFFSPIAPDIGDSELMLCVQRLPIPDSKTIHTRHVPVAPEMQWAAPDHVRHPCGRPLCPRPDSASSPRSRMYKA